MFLKLMLKNNRVKTHICTVSVRSTCLRISRMLKVFEKIVRKRKEKKEKIKIVKA